MPGQNSWRQRQSALHKDRWVFRPRRQSATVPDFPFVGEEREVDLSEAYGDKKFKKVKIRGLFTH